MTNVETVMIFNKMKLYLFLSIIINLQTSLAMAKALSHDNSSEIRILCSMKCSRKTLQNLLYFMHKKTLVVFFSFFISCNFIFLPYECPGLCWHRPEHSLGKNMKLHEMKNEKKLRGFSYYKNMANFEAFL